LLAGGAGCMTHNCDPTSANLDGGVITRLPSGDMIWSSSALAGPWLSFPGNVTIHVTLPAGIALANELPSYTVSTSANPGPQGGTSTPASGQLAEFTNLTATSFDVQNASCADYSVYMSAPVVPSGAPSGDAGSGDAHHD
jgi:hypothetical protein